MGLFDFFRFFFPAKPVVVKDMPNHAPDQGEPIGYNTAGEPIRIKTAYRIVTGSNSYRFLQFQLGEKWVYVPDPTSARVLGGDLLTKEECPESLRFLNEYRYYSCPFGTDGKLVEFANRYPYIDDYFAILPGDHQDYLRKEEEKRTRPTRYL